ncbi:hypothetical protein GCM10010259_03240 [Streptomyces daghestanicus]|nr:hypothetical protein GCM10010259_03240 [Streptomyces daghestanicus]GHI35305.1 hypothetical protein Sdagh_70350 [Streptomyces daghestanicus]
MPAIRPDMAWSICFCVMELGGAATGACDVVTTSLSTVVIRFYGDDQAALTGFCGDDQAALTGSCGGQAALTGFCGVTARCRSGAAR